ncbi:tetratricopeptide repeat protein [Roseateles aquatilis]|uniref:tetratricopeptide repeat protein n=1 Tax=Roseateles aquatilis TaxID=431061 RepID=UPI0013038326|nr:tetratricopeptide repeat protein [Roseateles aquatilis]
MSDPIDPGALDAAGAVDLAGRPAAPPDARQLLARAEELIERRRWKSAEEVLREGLKLEPDNLDLLTELARTRYAQDDELAALQLLRDVMAKQPSHFEGRYLLFHVLTSVGELAEAEAVIIELIRECPGAPGFYASYARLMLRTLNFDKARGLIAEALRLAPDSRDVLQVAALCDLVVGRSGRSGGTAGDANALRRLLIDAPDSRATLHLVINALIEQGRLREAYRLSKDLLRSQPDDPFALGRVRALAGEVHWAMRPLWPLQRWGWHAAVALWISGIAISRGLEKWAPDWTGLFLAVWLGYVVYSWVVPPLVRRWAAR